MVGFPYKKQNNLPVRTYPFDKLFRVAFPSKESVKSIIYLDADVRLAAAEPAFLTTSPFKKRVIVGDSELLVTVMLLLNEPGVAAL